MFRLWNTSNRKLSFVEPKEHLIDADSRYPFTLFCTFSYSLRVTPPKQYPSKR
jgi:hypothetical protein